MSETVHICRRCGDRARPESWWCLECARVVPFMQQVRGFSMVQICALGEYTPYTGDNLAPSHIGWGERETLEGKYVAANESATTPSAPRVTSPTISQTGLKVCTKCRAEKQRLCFSKLTKASDGLQYWCNECKRKAETRRRTRKLAAIAAPSPTLMGVSP